MSEKREFYASTVDDAIGKAARDLGLNAGDLSYRVIDPGNSGFLGIGARDARIEVDVPSASDTGDTEIQETATHEEEPQRGETEAVEDPVLAAEEDTTGLVEVSRAPNGIEQESVPQVAIDETGELVRSLVEAMGFEARLDVYDGGGFVAADVAPDNTALFIGQKGETIDALQYLVNAGINRNKSSRVRIVLDAEGYRQRRVEALQGMAHRTARKAVREDRTVELPPMNPSERRVVHLFLRDNPSVVTQSEGVGDSRRVRVSPV